MWILNIITPGATRPRRVALGSELSQVVLGRSSQCDVKIAYASLSRRHARLNLRPSGEVWLEDLKSSHGTFVNGERLLGLRRLEEGDAIALVEVTLTVEHVPEAMLSASLEVPALRREREHTDQPSPRQTPPRQTPPRQRPATPQQGIPARPVVAAEAPMMQQALEREVPLAKPPSRPVALAAMRRRISRRRRDGNPALESSEWIKTDHRGVKHSTGELAQVQGQPDTRELRRRTAARSQVHTVSDAADVLAALVGEDSSAPSMLSAPPPPRSTSAIPGAHRFLAPEPVSDEAVVALLRSQRRDGAFPVTDALKRLLNPAQARHVSGAAQRYGDAEVGTALALAVLKQHHGHRRAMWMRSARLAEQWLAAHPTVFAPAPLLQGAPR